MSVEINWKKKYMALRAKYMADIDVAFRMGAEQGMQQAQQQQAVEAEAAAKQAEQAAAMNGGMPGEEGQQPPKPGEEGQEVPGQEEGAPAAQGSELDQHISQLESMVGGGAKEGASAPKPEEIQKSLQAIISLRKAEKEAIEMKKSENAIKVIAKNLAKPKLGATAAVNLNNDAKKALTLQHKIVTDVMKAWETEESKAANDISNVLKVDLSSKE